MDIFINNLPGERHEFFIYEDYCDGLNNVGMIRQLPDSAGFLARFDRKDIGKIFNTFQSAYDYLYQNWISGEREQRIERGSLRPQVHPNRVDNTYRQ